MRNQPCGLQNVVQMEYTEQMRNEKCYGKCRTLEAVSRRHQTCAIKQSPREHRAINLTDKK